MLHNIIINLLGILFYKLLVKKRIETLKKNRNIVYATISPCEYFSTRVSEVIKGIGTKDRLLMRVLITKDENNMPTIKLFYKYLLEKDFFKKNSFNFKY